MHLVADKYEQISEDCRGPVRRELLRLQAMVEACHQFRVYGFRGSECKGFIGQGL